ncbi:hypothetical protein AVEN_84006-1 [Araneus ventricosus]|uniref:Integrase zinc-binding domain-containing protein n=1 Tax=Araneus ventricosus TaxID=182803 RepID=A0A4Y2BRM7_ARAVE|nr:hypothetical protein AVEN_84006-1 [Araneus ventricosus]
MPLLGSKVVHFSPFLKKNHLRLGRKLQFAPVTSEEKHSLLPDGAKMFYDILIYHTHVHIHRLGVRTSLSELSSYYWILHGREAIKQVIFRFLLCRFSKEPRGTEIEMTPCIPFSTTGIESIIYTQF